MIGQLSLLLIGPNHTGTADQDVPAWFVTRQSMDYAIAIRSSPDDASSSLVTCMVINKFIPLIAAELYLHSEDCRTCDLLERLLA